MHYASTPHLFVVSGDSWAALSVAPHWLGFSLSRVCEPSEAGVSLHLSAKLLSALPFQGILALAVSAYACPRLEKYNVRMPGLIVNTVGWPESAGSIDEQTNACIETNV